MGSAAAAAVYYHSGLCCCGRSRSSQIVSCSGGLRWQLLEKVDRELEQGNERSALSLVKDVQGKPDGLRCFGAARLVFFLISSFISIFSIIEHAHAPVLTLTIFEPRVQIYVWMCVICM